MATASRYVQLAKSLPEPLQRFFARWPPAAIVAEGTPPTAYQEARPNPFRFVKHPVTGKWQDPVYSLRRQAQIVDMAREHGVEHLLPETTKGTEYRLAHRVEHGLRVKGTGVGQKVKGHIHERQLISKYVIFLSRCRPDGAVETEPSLTRRLTRATGWRLGERQCWRCPNSSRPGSEFV
jgi:large subunit ribosomal protein L25